jgi:periplasmic protein TonB
MAAAVGAPSRLVSDQDIPADAATDSQFSVVTVPSPLEVAPLSVTSAPLACGLALALAAHAAILFLVLRAPPDFAAGAGGQLLDAINITLVSSDVLESREADRARSSAAAAAAVESHEGSPNSAPAAAQPKAGKDLDEREKTSRQEPETAPDAVLEATAEARKSKRAEADAAPLGADAARGSASVPTPASAPAAASPGVVREYANYVGQALAKTKPKGIGNLGIVRVKFVIAPSGQLTLVEVAKSSGSEKLDRIATQAVQHARFPTPPVGMTTAQLTFEIPYTFR